MNRRKLSTNSKYKTITLCATNNAQRSVLSDVCEKIDRELKAHPGRRLPYGFVSKLVAEMYTNFIWITRDKMMNHQRRKAILSRETEEPKIHPPIAQDRDIRITEHIYDASS